MIARNRHAMMRRRHGYGSGQFRDVHTPQDPQPVVTAEWTEGMLSDPGKRLAYTTGRRLFFAGWLPLQRFVRPPAQPNSPENLAVAPVQINARAALPHRRGGGL